MKFIFTPLQGVCIFCNGVKNALTQHRGADVCVCLMLAIALHSHSPTEQVDERGSDAVTAGSSYCAAPVVLFCRHTAFFSFMLSRSLSFFLTFLHRFMAVTMTTTSVNYFLSWIAVLLFSAFLSDTFIYACSPVIVLFFHSFTFT